LAARFSELSIINPIIPGGRAAFRLGALFSVYRRGTIEAVKYSLVTLDGEMLNPEDAPGAVRDLHPLAERWGISDDGYRGHAVGDDGTVRDGHGGL
jgi:hypothetical protein